MGFTLAGSNPADVAYITAPLVEWSNTLASGASPHLRAWVRIPQGARFITRTRVAQLAER